MRKLKDKSIDLMICDLPYGETNCKWDIKIDMEQFWKEFKRVRKSPRTACIHFCSTKFGYELIKSWEKGFKMDMVWKKRNKTGGLQSRNRPMRNHEMVYFFYDQAPMYNRDKYHKRIQAKPKVEKSDTAIFGTEPICKVNFGTGKFFEPPNPASVIEQMDEFGWSTGKLPKENRGKEGFEPKLPVSVVEEKPLNNPCDGKKSNLNSLGINLNKHKNYANQPNYTPLLPASVLEEDEPVTMFESTKVFIGKRHHQTEKPQDILEFFLKYWSNEGDTILDPTMGSGSTGVACNKLNRKFIGIELDETIFEVAKKRNINEKTKLI